MTTSITNYLPVVGGGIAGLGIAKLLFNVFFTDWDDFTECLRYVFTPDWLSLIRGECFEDFGSTLKVYVWVFLSAAGGAGVGSLISGWLA